MRIPFFKMHGAANDFLLVDDRQRVFPIEDRAWIARVAARRTGVGCDGILLIQPSEKADFRMRFLNPDGSEADLCGNGARCIARLAVEQGAAPPRMRIETAAGILGAEVQGEQVRVNMPDPKAWRLDLRLAVGGTERVGHAVNTGVPHAVVEVEDVDAVDVAALGRAIRLHEVFQPEGANANFIRVTGPGALRIRTYERGVEAETLACGTGITAAALIAARLGRVRLPVKVTPAGGDVVEIDARLDEDGASDVFMTGPAVHVFRGELDYEGG